MGVSCVWSKLCVSKLCVDKLCGEQVVCVTSCE